MRLQSLGMSESLTSQKRGGGQCGTRPFEQKLPTGKVAGSVVHDDIGGLFWGGTIPKEHWRIHEYICHMPVCSDNLGKTEGIWAMSLTLDYMCRTSNPRYKRARGFA